MCVWGGRDSTQASQIDDDNHHGEYLFYVKYSVIFVRY